MVAKVSHISLQKYLPFIAPVTNNGHILALCSYNGKSLLTEYSDKRVEQSDFSLQPIIDRIDWDEISEKKAHIFFEGLGHVFLTSLTLGANERIYWLFSFQQINQALTEERLDYFFKKLQHAAVCLIDDYYQTETTIAMADELSVRYEELNLFYGMDDSESLYKENDEETSLQQISQSCIDYLNIDYAAIYISEHDYFFHNSDPAIKIENENYLEQIIRQHLYSYILTNPETLVINRDNDIDWTTADLHIPKKIIAAPIRQVNRTPSGLLVLINSLERRDFSNSDRKLAEVLAAEASKLTQARRDSITGQLNRNGFSEILKKTLLDQASTGSNYCLLVINIDRFRLVNDTTGRAGGDQLLKQLTALILKNIKKSDILSRLGADEFAVILRQCSLQHAIEIAERIRLVIKQFRFLFQEKMFDLSACLGLVELNTKIKGFSQALESADLACSVAKEKGGNRLHIYKSTDEALLKHENQMLWVSRINLALEQNQFQIFRQKIERLQGDVASEEHYEILIRLKEKNGEILSPFHFIPAAERFNLMPKIDRWVIKTTLKRMAREFNKNPDSKLICSINLSGQSFSEEGFVAYIQGQILKFNIPADRLCLEMTETAAVSNLTQAVKFMEQLKAIGCQFSLDDFGSGMSSFTYLKNLPVDYLKIDGYFVKTMMENKIDRAMVTAIHQIGSVMGLKTIAEFVENDDIMNELRAMGVNYGQGYGIHKPEHFV